MSPKILIFSPINVILLVLRVSGEVNDLARSTLDGYRVAFGNLCLDARPT